MKKFIAFILFLLVAAAAFFVLVSRTELPPPDPEVAKLFQKVDYKTALTQAKKEKKVVMLDFTASWCGPCRVMEKNTFGNDQVKQLLAESTIPIQVDGDKERGMVKQFRVPGYPTVIFVDGEGEEIGRMEGYHNAERFLEKATRFVRKD